jgi:hypothetical protein
VHVSRVCCSNARWQLHQSKPYSLHIMMCTRTGPGDALQRSARDCQAGQGVCSCSGLSRAAQCQHRYTAVQLTCCGVWQLGKEVYSGQVAALRPCCSPSLTVCPAHRVTYGVPPGMHVLMSVLMHDMLVSCVQAVCATYTCLCAFFWHSCQLGGLLPLNVPGHHNSCSSNAHNTAHSFCSPHHAS